MNWSFRRQNVAGRAPAGARWDSLSVIYSTGSFSMSPRLLVELLRVANYNITCGEVSFFVYSLIARNGPIYHTGTSCFSISHQHLTNSLYRLLYPFIFLYFSGGISLFRFWKVYWHFQIFPFRHCTRLMLPVSLSQGLDDKHLLGYLQGIWEIHGVCEEKKLLWRHRHKWEASETSVFLNETTRHHVPEGCHIRGHFCLYHFLASYRQRSVHAAWLRPRAQEISISKSLIHI
jgi:hypothetical protein